MYTVISLVFALIIAFALSNLFNFFIVLAISAVCIYFLMCYIGTIVTKENVLINWAADVVEDKLSDVPLFWWFVIPLSGFGAFLEALLLAALIAVFFVGGLITAPVWQFLSKSKPKRNKIIFLSFATLVLIGLYAYGIMLLFNPLFIYRYIHFGLIIGVFIAAAVIFFALTLYYKLSKQIKTAPAIIFSVAEVGLLPIMICGIVLSMNTVYSVTVAEDMNVLANAPISYETAIVLENDLDFTDKSVNWYGACNNFKGVFDGKGHTISNVTFRGEFKHRAYGSDSSALTMGFIIHNEGIIRNVTFENCKITVQNLNDEKSDSVRFKFISEFNEGKIENCTLVDCQAKYVSKINYVSTSLGGDGVEVIIENIDEEFYKEPCPIYGKNWVKID